MNKLTEDEHQELTGGGECHLHHHPDTVSHADIERLEGVKNIVEVVANYAVPANADIVVADTTGGNITVTLPLAVGFREYTIVKGAAANTVTVDFQTGQTCFGATSVSLVALGEVARFKALNNKWIRI